MKQLSVRQKQYLKGLAHSLAPVVIIGSNGLTAAVIKEINLNLDAHELIKIRILGDDRNLRLALIEEMCNELQANFVQHIGKLVILYRPSDKAKIVLAKE